MEKIDEMKDGFHKRLAPGMTKERLREICKQNKLYIIPRHNDVLYLHFKGFSKIENLEEYTGLKCLWIENNCLTNISGLENQTELVGLYMHNNAISKIENLDCLIKLNTLNLSHNFVKIIENLDHLRDLNSLIMSHNKLSTASDIAHLASCKTLSILDLSYNYLDDPEIVDVFTNMESLRVLSLTGNSVISKIKNYRKTLTIKCKELRNLDERPIFKKDRLCAEAWSTGGIEAEQAMRTKLNQDEQKVISDSVRAIMSMRRNRNVQITPSASGDSGYQEGVDGRDSTDSLIVSKDYYDECDSSDDDSADDGSPTKAAIPLVCEIVNNNDGEDDSTDNFLTRENSTDNEVLSDFESDVVDRQRDRIEESSTCTATVDCGSGRQEDIDGCYPSVIGIVNDSNESAERLDEKCEHSVDSKADTFDSEVVNIAVANNTEPSLKQCTDDLLSSNDSTELVIERTKNKFDSVETIHVNAEINSDENEKCVKTNLDFNDDKNSNENYNNNNVINNHYRSFGGSIEINKTIMINIKNDSETFKSDLKKGVECLPTLCSEQSINTSQILCAKKLYTLDIIDHNSVEEESGSSTTCKSDQNQIQETPIRLPWLLPSQTEEEYYIKKSSE
ncbi:dynein axonemal assembly factor 1-like [Rhopalosiphum padi]|uniref:dynein axonemal assembly factor 1-like n=1 Tax=Rhopalosiphum padi TaxID=40932 RepID=UPI00298DA285|nr:dynein axonemal assembly factor 1-like [Rhopalosiphum padi]